MRAARVAAYVEDRPGRFMPLILVICYGIGVLIAWCVGGSPPAGWGLLSIIPGVTVGNMLYGTRSNPSLLGLIRRRGGES